jgi:hypothetical protein
VVRREHIEELFRVADRWVIFTYFDRASLKNLIRRAATAVGLNKKHPKNTLSRAQVQAIAKAAGFQIHQDPMLFVVGSGHRLVLAERI